MKNVFGVFCILLLHTGITGQVAVSYYLFQSQLSLSTNTEKTLWLDYRVETNSFLSNMNMEISPMWNFKKMESANYYAGPGVSFNLFYIAADIPYVNGYFLDIGARIKPFEKNRSVQIIFEISPYINSRATGGNLRTRLGLAYNFVRDKNKPLKKEE